MKKSIVFILMLSLMLTLFAGCSKGNNATGEFGSSGTDITDTSGFTVTDMLGRSVSFTRRPQKFVCIGAGALRLYSYIGDMSKLCGVEECEKGFLISVRPYQIIHEELFKSLPSVGAGGPQGAANAEALLSVHPDVIFSLYTSDASAADELQAATGTPVVVLSYGKTEAFDEAINSSIEIMGKVIGREERARELTAYINALKNDLDSRTASVPDAAKKTVYIGCQSNYGTHGIGSSSADYSLFDAVNALNVLDINGYKGYQKALDFETIVTLNPQVIILDAGGLSLFKEEYVKNKQVFDSLSAFKNNEVYLQMPYNAYYTNLEIAYADAYFAGKVLFPEQFSDIDIAAEFDEISKALLGSASYGLIKDDMYGGYQKLDLSAIL